jgi:hypothetical protein
MGPGGYACSPPAPRTQFHPLHLRAPPQCSMPELDPTSRGRVCSPSQPSGAEQHSRVVTLKKHPFPALAPSFPCFHSPYHCPTHGLPPTDPATCLPLEPRGSKDK